MNVSTMAMTQNAPLLMRGPVGMQPMAAQSTMVLPQSAAMMGAPQATATLGAEAVKAPSTMSTVLKSALAMTGLGAALGAGATMLPFIPGAPLIGGLVGAGVGAIIGIVRGIKKARRQKDELNALSMGSNNAPMPLDQMGPEVPVTPLAVPHGVRKAKHAAKAAKKRARYTVKHGDTLGSIAKAHHLDVATLHKANKAHVHNPNRISVGQHLVIPRRTKKH